MIYKITIRQYCGGYHYETSESYDSVASLKKAFEYINSEQMFGTLVYENISPDWENDIYSEVERVKGNWKTRISTCSVIPLSVEKINLYGAFAMDRGMNLLKCF